MSLIKVLALTQYYWPGYMAGGSLRSVQNLVDRLGNEFQFSIVTGDRDLRSPTPYQEVCIGQWQEIGRAKVFYTQTLSFRQWLSFFRDTDYDVLYLNSFFSYHFSIQIVVLRRLKLLPNKPIVIAPRGEFSPGALSQKSMKKKLYRGVSSLFNIYSGVTWQASSQAEADYVKKIIGVGAHVVVAPDLPEQYCIDDSKELVLKKPKKAGRLSVVFLGRIARVKNIIGALGFFSGLIGEVSFSIFGLLEDERYWQECQELMNALPPNITVRYGGVIPHEQIMTVLQSYEVLLLPTLGENYGHVIIEAWQAGLPVLLSDRTSWRGLAEKHLGWDIPLERPIEFHKVLQQLTDMDESEYRIWSENARQYGNEMAESVDAVEANRRLFTDAAGNRGAW